MAKKSAKKDAQKAQGAPEAAKASPETPAAKDDAADAAAPEVNVADAEAQSAQSDEASLLEAARQEAKKHYDDYLRAMAELDNVRRRSEKKISEAHQFALTGFSLAIGEVRDCLEAALQPESNAEKMREGVELTLRKLIGAMDDHHISTINPDIGVSFDPTLHMAIGTAPASAEAPANTVAHVIQVGYMLSGRVIRAANVMVAQDAKDAGESASEPPAEK